MLCYILSHLCLSVCLQVCLSLFPYLSLSSFLCIVCPYLFLREEVDDGEGSLGTNVVIERIISTRSGLHHFLQHETCLGPGILSLYGNPVFFFFALCTLKETLFLSRNPLLTQKCFPCSEFLDLFCSCPVLLQYWYWNHVLVLNQKAVLVLVQRFCAC